MDWPLIWENLPLLLPGLGWTVILSAVGMVLALGMGGMLLAMRASRWPWVRRVAAVYTEIILGMPILVLLFVIFFVLPAYKIVIDPVPAGLLTLMLYYSPYVAEIMRGALESIPPGQWEAGYSVGMAHAEILRRIIIPQTLGVMLPPLTGILIGLIKDSAILSVISVTEFTFQAKQVISRTYAPFEIYLVVAVGYWILTFVLELSMRRIEHQVTAYRFSGTQ